MSYYEHKCDKCGNTYIPGDEYCRNCNAPLPVTEISDGELLDGMQKSDWHIFIDKNSSRYTEIFAQNEGKKIFFHMNWSAFFFSL